MFYQHALKLRLQAILHNKYYSWPNRLLYLTQCFWFSHRDFKGCNLLPCRAHMCTAGYISSWQGVLSFKICCSPFNRITGEPFLILQTVQPHVWAAFPYPHTLTVSILLWPSRGISPSLLCLKQRQISLSAGGERRGGEEERRGARPCTDIKHNDRLALEITRCTAF